MNFTVSNWAEDCAKRGILVYLIKKKDDKQLFLTKEKPNDDPLGRIPIYQVWCGDKRIYCGHNINVANQIFESE